MTGISWGCHPWPLPSAALEESGEDKEADRGPTLLYPLIGPHPFPSMPWHLQLPQSCRAGWRPLHTVPGLQECGLRAAGREALAALAGPQTPGGRTCIVIRLILRMVTAVLVAELRI